MIARRILILSLALGCFLVAPSALTPSALAAPVSQNTLPVLEPNNSFGKATPIVIDDATQDTISPRGDVDWYRFTVERHGELQVRVTNVAATLDIAFRIFDAERNLISDTFVPFAKGRDTQGIIDLPGPGNYFIEVQDNGGDADSAQPYTLQIVFAPADGPEPNNRFGDAAPLTLSEPVQATILPIRDNDWFYVDVDTHGELVVLTTDVPPTLDIMFRCYNSDTEVIHDWFYPLTTGADNYGAVDVPAAGRYYIEVRDQGDNARSVEPFTLEVGFTPSPDPAEPNNSFGHATAVTVGEPFTATVLPRYDDDWYRFEVVEQGALSVTVANVPAELDIAFRIWNGNRETLTDWFRTTAPGQDTTGSVDLSRPGVYLVELTDNNDDARSIEPYTLLIDLMPTGDVAEPNESFGTAYSLGPGGEHDLQATILPYRDADWYAVDLDSAGVLTVTLTNVPADIDLDFRTWTANRDLLVNWFSAPAPGDDTVGSIDIPEPGRYLIEVHDRNDDARSVEPYTLRTTIERSPDANEPNQELAAATPITMDVGIAGVIFPRGDVDWYRIEIAEPGDLYLLVTDVAPELDIVMRLFRADGNAVADWLRPAALGSDTSGMLTLADAGTYYLQVADNAYDARSLQPYTLVVSTQLIDAAAIPLPDGQPRPAVTPLPADEDTPIGEPTPVTAPPVEEPAPEAAGAVPGAPIPDTAPPAIEPTPEPTTEALPASAATIGAAGGELAVDAASDPLAGALLSIPPDAVAADTDFTLAASAASPAGAPLGLFPAGYYWTLAWAGDDLATPASIALPVPDDLAATPMFLGGWTGDEWVSLSDAADGELAGPVETGGVFAAFCGSLTDYRAVGFTNNTRSREIDIALVSGPLPLGDDDTTTVVGCPPPADPAATLSVRRRSTGEFLMRPGRYELDVTYLLPEPVVTTSLLLTVPPGAEPLTVEVAEEGASSEDTGLDIEFGGRGG